MFLKTPIKYEHLTNNNKLKFKGNLSLQDLITPYICRYHFHLFPSKTKQGRMVLLRLTRLTQCVECYLGSKQFSFQLSGRRGGGRSLHNVITLFCLSGLSQTEGFWHVSMLHNIHNIYNIVSLKISLHFGLACYIRLLQSVSTSIKQSKRKLIGLPSILYKHINITLGSISRCSDLRFVVVGVLRGVQCPR